MGWSLCGEITEEMSKGAQNKESTSWSHWVTVRERGRGTPRVAVQVKSSMKAQGARMLARRKFRIHVMIVGKILTSLTTTASTQESNLTSATSVGRASARAPAQSTLVALHNDEPYKSLKQRKGLGPK